MSKHKFRAAITFCASATRIRTVLAAAVLSGLEAAPAAAGQIDCKVILCLAGGFPAGCSDAHSYMIGRVTDTPPKPPYGTCETVSPGGAVGIYSGARSRMFTLSEPPVCEEEWTDYGRDGGTHCLLWSIRHSATIRISVETGTDQPPYTNDHIWRTWQTFTRVDPASDTGR